MLHVLHAYIVHGFPPNQQSGFLPHISQVEHEMEHPADADLEDNSGDKECDDHFVSLGK